MKRMIAVVTVSTGLALGSIATANAASTNDQMRQAVLTAQQMLQATGVRVPLVRDKFTCGSSEGLRGCGLLLKSPNGSDGPPPGVAAPFASGVYLARTPGAAKAYLAKAQRETPGDGQSVESSTPSQYVTTTDFLGQGYISFGIRLDGAKVLTAACSGSKVTRAANAGCVQKLLYAQSQKASRIR